MDNSIKHFSRMSIYAIFLVYFTWCIKYAEAHIRICLEIAHLLTWRGGGCILTPKRERIVSSPTNFFRYECLQPQGSEEIPFFQCNHQEAIPFFDQITNIFIHIL
mmetsp:Transcript_13307/g.18063  ORF Transcript_13307/g.18063 Transcript_13307/m.18063 type:complete len:105 (+) Transcript_13307:320-634(+)